MYRHHRPSRLGIALVSGALMVAIATPVSGQLVVYDAATTARNTVTAAVKEFLFETERQQHAKLREMARRLSALTNLRKYAIEEVPRWRTHGGDFFYAQPYNDALIFGDSSGSAFMELSHRLLADVGLLDRVFPEICQRTQPSRHLPDLRVLLPLGLEEELLHRSRDGVSSRGGGVVNDPLS